VEPPLAALWDQAEDGGLLRLQRAAPPLTLQPPPAAGMAWLLTAAGLPWCPATRQPSAIPGTRSRVIAAVAGAASEAVG